MVDQLENSSQKLQTILTPYPGLRQTLSQLSNQELVQVLRDALVINDLNSNDETKKTIPHLPQEVIDQLASDFAAAEEEYRRGKYVTQEESKRYFTKLFRTKYGITL